TGSVTTILTLDNQVTKVSAVSASLGPGTLRAVPNPLEDVARGLRVIGDQIKRTVGNDPAGEWIADRIDALRPAETPVRSLAELQEELDSLVGLETVKEQVRALVAFLQVQARRLEHGLPEVATSQHLVFLGNPGTG